MYSIREIYKPDEIILRLVCRHEQGGRRCTAQAHMVGDKHQKDTYKLVSEKQHSLEAELAIAEVEQIFERRAQKVKHHGVVVALSAEPPDKWHTNATSESLIDLGLIFKLRVLGFD